ncbi:hypothetical protein GCM10012275_26630 [Longimycelium tulufanense]|uniref:DUF402 domain-containing protein n=1 Tax=Longimycelium tulufanense TaxID=907463 RepID=A0A8J3FV07_9PSEU|nr:DUF402 domain-containing protein [Longimycelium tulufanense]GGM54213.1 hypothetical protein GCM10012275_26630 [Longimycelium tulufanense]
MGVLADGGRVWQPGETAVLRFVRRDGSLGQHHPMRTLRDDGSVLLAWLPVDTEIVGTRLVDGRDQRDASLTERFTLPRERFRSRWHRTSNVRLIDEDSWSSVWWFFEPDGTFHHWYVNLEVPVGRTAHTVDRRDGVLDLRVSPDRGWEWKDEDEAGAAVDAGLFTAAEMAQLRAEGERMIALAEAGRFPFDGTWCDFRPEPGWDRPRLPDAVGAAG